MLFEAPDARCPELPRKLFGYVVGHDYHAWEVIDVGPWGPSDWYQYEVTGKCQACGARKRVFGISEGGLKKAGVEIPRPSKENL